MNEPVYAVDTVSLKSSEEAELVYIPEHKPRDPKKLNAVKNFAAHYALMGNGKEAAAQVYDLQGQSAANKASRLLKNTYVDALVTMYARELATNDDAYRAYVIRRLKEMSEIDVGELMDEKGNLKPISEWDSVTRKSISKLEVKTSRSVKPGGEEVTSTDYKVHLPDKTKVVEMLGKHVSVGAFKENKEINVSITGIDSLHQKRLGNEATEVVEEEYFDEEF